MYICVHEYLFALTWQVMIHQLVRGCSQHGNPQDATDSLNHFIRLEMRLIRWATHSAVKYSCCFLLWSFIDLGFTIATPDQLLNFKKGKKRKKRKGKLDAYVWFEPRAVKKGMRNNPSVSNGLKMLAVMDTYAHTEDITQQQKITSLRVMWNKLTESYEPFLSSRLSAIQAFEERGALSDLKFDITISRQRRSDPRVHVTSGQGISE